MFHEELGQSGQHVIGVEPPRNRDRHALAAELVNYRQHFERSPIDGAVGHEIVSPHVIRVLWPQPDTRAIVEPQPSAFRLFGRYLSPSRCQMRSTRLRLTRQPAARSNAVTRR